MTKQKVVKVPGAKCDLCGKPAKYDGPTIYGPWAYVCENHTRELNWPPEKCTKIDASEDEECST